MSKKDITVYMIGNAHIDPVWLWRWQEGLAETLATCRSALDRMNEYPAFVFTRADAATYKWIEDSNPEMFEEIRQRVKEGRWNIVGGWWEQPDCNIPSGESFVRHELYGKRYFLDKFDFDVKVGYNADSFGHNAGLPQILSKAGINYYVFMRPGPHEKELPESIFWWEGPDGSRVLCHRIRDTYATWWPDLTEHANACAANRAKGTSVTACFYGVGNHGGGPTIENIECINRMKTFEDAPMPVFGKLQDMFEHVLSQRTDFEVVKDDLQHHAVGCYTSHSEIKALNRKAENMLVSAEKFCLLAKVTNGRAFPKDKFAEAWKKVLFNQFHDIMAGTSIAVAYDDVRDTMGAAIDAADYETYTSLSGMACKIDASGEGNAFVVFNPHPHEVKCAIYVDENPKSLKNSNGEPIPFQVAIPIYDHTGDRTTQVFVDTLPALGYSTYYASDWEESAPKGKLEISETSISSDFYDISIDPKTGAVLQIVDSELGELLKAPASAVVIDDPSDTWSHDVVAFSKVAGRFSNAKVEVIENGPVRATIRIESKFGESTLWQDISLYAELKLIEYRINLDWHEKHRMLKFEFPINLQNPVATYDAAYAAITHPTDGAENPGQKWIDVTGTGAKGTFGVSLLNESKYGFDVEGSTMRLTALRSPIYAFHDPRKEEEDTRYHYMDKGMHSFSFALLPHAGGWQEAGTVQEALVMNMRPLSVEIFNHKGEWPSRQSFGSVSAPNVDICAMKEAEDGDALIVRLYETAGKATDTVLTIAGGSYLVKLGTFELKTLKIENGEAVELDLIERP